MYTAFDRDICYMPVVPQTNSSVMILRMINDTESIHFSLYPCPSKYTHKINLHISTILT